MMENEREARGKLLEDKIKLSLFAVNPYYTNRAPRLQARVRAALASGDETEWQECVERVEKLLRGDSPKRSDPPAPQYVTLDQMSAISGMSKPTLNRRKNRANNPLPLPDVEGGGGKADQWIWSKIRAWLEADSGRELPERFPQRV